MNTQLSLNFDEKPMKRCPGCKQILNLDCFRKNKSKRDGFGDYCRKCESQYQKYYRENNKEKIIKRNERYYQNNREREIKKNKKYRQKNRERIAEQGKKYNHKNRERIAKRRKRYYQNNRKKILEQTKQYQQNNKEKIAKKVKKYRQNNKEKHNEYSRKRIKKDPKFKLNHNMRALIRNSLKRRNISKNGNSWESLVNFTLEELMTHLEGLFRDGMTWKNYGKWHVDHIKPISLFDFESVEDPEFKECWTLENLQPLWAKENLRKHTKYNLNKGGNFEKENEGSAPLERRAQPSQTRSKIQL